MFEILSIKDPSDVFQVESYCSRMHEKIALLESKIDSSGLDPKEIVNKYLSFSNIGGGYDLVSSLLSVKHQYPELCANDSNLNSVRKKINSLFKRFHQKTELNRSFQPYRILNPLQETHDQLVIGCGHAVNDTIKQCDGHSASTYFVDLSKKSKPDLRADYYHTEFWKEFKDGSFQEVFIEGWAPDFCEQSLKEISRILKPNGKARIGINSTYTQISDKYEDLGFSKIEFVTEELFSCNRMMSCSMLWLHKSS